MNIKVICDKCNKEFDIYKKTYDRKIKNNESFLCKECRYKKQAEFNRNYMNSLSDEEKSKRSKQSSEGAKKQWQNMTKEEKIKRSKNSSERMSKYNSKRWSDISIEGKETAIKRINEGRNKWYSNLSQEEKNNKIQLLNIRYNEWWNSLSEEEKENWSKQSSENRIKYLENLSDEERTRQHKLLSKSLRKYWNNISNEEREKYSKMASERNRKRWGKLSDKERLYYIKILHDSNIGYWSTLSNDDRQKISNKMKDAWNNLSDNEKNGKLLLLQNGNKAWWNNLQSTEREAIIRKNLLSSSGKNKLHLHFESRFNEDSYNLIPEYPTTNNGVTHCWDYALFRDNELCMLVDLDGKYFHADECDYDGIHSKEEYDEKRGLSIPDGVKWCIIYEKDFDKSFTYMQCILPLSYDEFIDKRFKEYRSMPFPYPEYTSSDLLKYYNQLQRMNCDDKYHKSLNVNTRIGDRLIQHFHHSLYDNIIDAWNNDETLRSMIKDGYLYHSYLNKNKILQGFNIYEPCKRVQYISAGKAKMLINRYLNDYDEIFNPFSGYGGIMLACIAMNKRYIGICNDDIQRLECDNMLSFLRDNGVDMNVSLSVSDSSQTSGTYQCLFANNMNDDLIDVCLRNFKCRRYLFVVGETNKYKNNIGDVITNKLYYRNKYEKIIVIEGQ